MWLALFVIVGTLFTLMFLVTIRSIVRQGRNDKGLIGLTVMFAMVFFYLCTGFF